MKIALLFQKDGDGIIIGYSKVLYKHFLIDLKNKGYKPDRWGYATEAEATAAGNLCVGTDGSTEPVTLAMQTEENESEPQTQLA